MPILIVGCVLGILAVFGWLARGLFSEKHSTVEVFTVQADSSPGGSGFAAGGYLEVIPPGPLIITTMVEGRVESVDVNEGHVVKAGDILARIDEVLYRQEVKARESSVALAKAKLARLEAGFRPEEISQAKSDLDRAIARLKQAEATYKRYHALHPSGVISGQQYEASIADLAAAKSELAKQQAEVELRLSGYRKEDIAVARSELIAAEGELDKFQWKLAACVIKAPISGVVLERFAQPGEWISPAASRERPGAVVSLIDPKRLQAWVDVNQRDIGRVLVGQEATLVTDASPGEQVKGRVALILPKSNLQKNTTQVKVEIPNVPTSFRPEMSVKVTFMAGEGGTKNLAGVSVPASAMIRQGSKAGVFIYTDGRARYREVEVREESAGKPTLLSGAAPGDRLILNAEGLSDGQAVELKR